MKRFTVSLFIFRRDLRLYDNRGLVQAAQQSEQVIPCFIFDPRQVGDNNKYRSQAALQFMIEALQSLDQELHKQSGRLYLFYGNPSECVKHIAQNITLDAIFYNRDYTPFSRKRDQELETTATSFTIPVVSCNDLLLTEPEAVMTRAGSFYKTYTPFFTTARSITVEKPHQLSSAHWYTKKLRHEQPHTLYTEIAPTTKKSLVVHGTHKAAQKIFHTLKNHTAYATERNIPSIETTHLSAYLKFGLLSVRHVYHELAATVGLKNPLIAQLYWRDFFTHQLFHVPHLLGHAGVAKYDALSWSYDKKQFHAWCDGMTGFPIVDAGMRQLNTTGFMHNRVRMITASFLIKDLGIDWQWGERYFAQKLVDYDPALNNGNWQWVASTGTCAQPYFRIFNPWLQQKRYDPDCLYIKQWIPELKTVSAQQLHTLFKAKHPVVKGYPLPMLDHAKAAKQAVRMFKQRS